jgi:ABC-2 type transport system permease protein
MMHLYRAFAAQLRADVSVMLHYRAEILLWATWGLVNPAVLYALWRAAAGGHASGAIAGYDRGEIAAYFLMIMIVGHFTTAWDVHDMGYHVRSGSMSAKLLRPILPIWDALAVNLSYKIATIAFVTPSWLLFAWFVTPTFHAGLWQITLGLISILLASLLNFVLGYVIALIAFWSPKLDSVGELYFGAGMLFGGRFCPLPALPSLLSGIADWLPFKWMFSFPSELMIGRVTRLSDAWTGIAIQLVWLVVLIVVFQFAWRAAVKRYTAVSG